LLDGRIKNYEELIREAEVEIKKLEEQTKLIPDYKAPHIAQGVQDLLQKHREIESLQLEY
jgi:hypothetical protein